MGFLNGSWASSATFWAVAAVVVGVASVIFGWIAVNPKRTLFYDMPTIAPLLNAGDIKDLKVLHSDQLLSAPQVLEIILASQGRSDISNESFNGGAPLRLDVNAKIVEILRVESVPDEHGNPKVSIDDTVLAIGPSLIGGRQRTSISLLVDGVDPVLSRPSSPLVNVKLAQGSPPSFSRTPHVRIPFLTVSLLLIAVVLIWSWGQVVKNSASSGAFLPAMIAAVVCGYIVFALISAVLDSIGLFRKAPKWIRRNVVSYSSPVGAVIGLMASFFLLVNYSPPFFGTQIDSYSVGLPIGSSIPLRQERFLPSLEPGIIRFSNNQITSTAMLLGASGAASPTFEECAAFGEQNGKHSIEIPFVGRSSCAADSDFVIAMKVTSMNDQRITLQVTVWDNQT